eukprot:scaffold6898_cov149-Amphora_coffeaeformis.AAC.3
MPQRAMLVRHDSSLSVSSEASTRARQLLASRGLESLTSKKVDTKVPATIIPPSPRSALNRSKLDLYARQQDESESTHNEDFPINVHLSPSPPPSRINCLSKNSRATNRARQLVNTESWKGLNEMAQFHASLASMRAAEEDWDDDSEISFSDDDDDEEQDILLFAEEDD